MKELRIVRLLSRLEGASTLDPAADVLASIVNRAVRPRPVRDALHGVPTGHPVHPVAVMLPIGCWLGAALLDVVPGTRRASRILVGAGILGVGPAALPGLVDWSELHEQQKRVGLVHAALNVVAAGTYAVSFARRGPHSAGTGKLVGLLGLAVVSASGFIGGHLSYRQAAGANHAEHVPHLFPEGWHRLAAESSLPDGELTGVEVEGQPLVALRRGTRIDVLSSSCSHLAGPLSEGSVVEEGGVTCIECPWHASRFDVETGEVVHGPATAPQPRFDTRIADGVVEVRLQGAG